MSQCLSSVVRVAAVFVHIYAVWGMPRGGVPSWISRNYCKARYADVPWDCTGYLHCQGTRGIWQHCPANLQFDLSTKTCALPKPDSCQNKDAVAQTLCSQLPDLVFAHQTSCTLYYNCSSTSAQPQRGLSIYEDECKWPELFDPVKVECRLDNVPEEPIRCGNTPVKRCDYASECRRPIEDDCSSLDDGLHPALEIPFTRKYIECSGGVLKANWTCDEGTVFDPLKRSCTANYLVDLYKYCQTHPAVTFPDPDNCAQFYDCSKSFHHAGLDPFQTECPYMYLYDRATRGCQLYNETAEGCGNRFEPKAPCEYTVGQCLGRAQCLPCSANCSGLPDGLVANPSYPRTRHYLNCRHERTVDALECEVPQIFRTDLGSCGSRDGIPVSKSTSSPIDVRPASTTTAPSQSTGSTPTTDGTSSASQSTSTSGENTHTATTDSTIVTETTPISSSGQTSISVSPSAIPTTPVANETTTSNPASPITSESASTTTETPTNTTSSRGPISTLAPPPDSPTTADTTTQRTTDTSTASTTTTSAPKCECGEEILFLNATMDTLAGHLLKLNETLDGKVQAPFTCNQPPTTEHAEVQVSYSPTQAIATYTCDRQHALCDWAQAGKTTCHRDNVWAPTPGRCYKNVFTQFTDNTTVADCPGQNGSFVSMTGKTGNRSVSIVLSMSTEHPCLVELNVSTRSVTVGAGPGKPVPAEVNVQSDIRVTFQYQDYVFDVALDGHAIGSCPHNGSFPGKQELSWNDGFQPDEVAFHKDGQHVPQIKEWSPSDCPTPPDVPNARAYVSDATTGSRTAVYKCHTDFYLTSNSDTKICVNNQGWSDTTIDCQRSTFVYTHPSLMTTSGMFTEDLTGLYRLGYQLEIWVVPLQSVFGFALVENNAFKAILRIMNLPPAVSAQSDISTESLITSYQPFTINKESKVVITFLSDQLHMVVDGRLLLSMHGLSEAAFITNKLQITSSLFLSKMRVVRSEKVRKDMVSMNLAQGRDTASSSAPSDAANAVDVTSGPPAETCWMADTGDEYPFWRVDVIRDGEYYYISGVAIIGSKLCPSGDSACENRLHDFDIEVTYLDPAKSSNEVLQLCNRSTGIFPQSERTIFSCNEDVAGRYVTIRGKKRDNDNDRFTLCNVEIYGYKATMSGLTNMDCPQPGPMAHAKVYVKTTPAGLEAYTECIAGYSLCGSGAPRACVGGIWEEPNGYCFRSEYYYLTQGKLHTQTLDCPLSLEFRLDITGTVERNDEFEVELSVDAGTLVKLRVKLSTSNGSGVIEIRDIQDTDYSFNTPDWKDIFIPGRQFHLSISNNRPENDEIKVSVSGTYLGSVPITSSFAGEPVLRFYGLNVDKLKYGVSNAKTTLIEPTTNKRPAITKSVLSMTEFLFKVKACEDVTIEFQDPKAIDSVNIVLGQRHNTQSSYSSSTNAGEFKWHSSLSCGDFKSFWLKWDADTVDMGDGLTVGKETLFAGIPAAFKKENIIFGPRNTEWIFPPSEDVCPSPKGVELKSYGAETNLLRKDFSCGENMEYCGFTRFQTCPLDASAITEVSSGKCAVNRMPSGTGASGVFPLPCMTSYGSSISVYLTPDTQATTYVFPVALKACTKLGQYCRVNVGPISVRLAVA